MTETFPLDAPTVYQGQFGEFTITNRDRRDVIIYRSGLLMAALCFSLATGLVLWQGQNPSTIRLITPLYSVFCISLAVSLLTIHIYMAVLHRALQIFLAVGAIASLWIGHTYPEPFAQTIYTQPLSILGVGFVFAALTGIFFKEGFCFGRLETKVLTPIVPLLLLGHLLGWLPLAVEQSLLAIWAVFFMIFAIRKVLQPIPPDIGDKSVFEMLKQRH
jgi:uncharacterized integral membrane protein